jgi:hypothetical protein
LLKIKSSQMENLPIYISIFFILTTLLTLWFLYKASHSKTLISIIVIWLLLQGSIAYSGFYLVSRAMPPRFVLVIGPPLIAILVLFFLPKGRKFLDSLDIEWLTYLHIVRIPVEVTLYFLFLHKLVPQLITFEGTNPDILSGLTVPVIAYFVFYKQKFGKKILLIWNFICLCLLFNVVSTAILAAPFAFQQFSFEQPTIGVLYFPFVWLPGFIVPAVLFSHLAVIRAAFKIQNLPACWQVQDSKRRNTKVVLL